MGQSRCLPAASRILPEYAGIEGVLLLLVERLHRDDRAEAGMSAFTAGRGLERRP